jgi:hypothetical protein
VFLIGIKRLGGDCRAPVFHREDNPGMAVSGTGTSEKLTSFISSVEEPGVGTFSVSGADGSAGSDMAGAVTAFTDNVGNIAISTSHGTAGSASSVQVFTCTGEPGGC